MALRREDTPIIISAACFIKVAVLHACQGSFGYAVKAKRALAGILSRFKVLNVHRPGRFDLFASIRHDGASCSLIGSVERARDASASQLATRTDSFAISCAQASRCGARMVPFHDLINLFFALLV